MLIENEVESQEDIAPEEVKLENTVEEASSDVPEKYRGKSLGDIVHMHQEAEKLIGKQAQEVGEVRKLADELIKHNLGNAPAATKEQEPEVDFFEDPKKAIQATVDRHPDIVAARQAAGDFKKMQVHQKLSKEHPDFVEVAQDPEFANWVKMSPIRLGLWAKADGEFDYDSANELLSTYKELRGVKAK